MWIKLPTDKQYNNDDTTINSRTKHNLYEYVLLYVRKKYRIHNQILCTYYENVHHVLRLNTYR